MKRFLLFLLLALPVFSQTRYVTSVTPTVVAILLSDGRTIPNGVGVLTNNNGVFGWGSAGAPSVGAAGSVQFSDGAGGFNASTNLFWDNLDGFLGVGTTTPASEIDIVSTAITHSPSINVTYAQGGSGDYAAGLHFFNENGLNGAFAATANGYVGGLSPNQLALVAFLSGGLNLYSAGPTIFSGSVIFSRFDGSTGALLIGSDTDDGTGAFLQVSGDVHLTGKLTSDGGIDPPWLLYDANTRAAVKDDADAKLTAAKKTGAVQFWNGANHQFEIYAPSENKFYAMDGKTALQSPTAQELTVAASKRQANKAAPAKRAALITTNSPAINANPSSKTPH